MKGKRNPISVHKRELAVPGSVGLTHHKMKTMLKYLIVIEKTETGFSSYFLDLLGCLSTGATRSEVEANMREAIEFHLEGMEEAGDPIPHTSSESAYLAVGVIASRRYQFRSFLRRSLNQLDD